MAETKDLVDEFLQRSTIAERGRLRRTRAIVSSVLAVVLVLAAVASWFAIQANRQESDLEVAATRDAQQARDLESAATTEAQQARNLEAAATTDAGRLIALGTSQAEAELQRLEAERKSRIALARQLAAQAAHNLDHTTDIELSLLLSVEAVMATRNTGMPPVREASEVLRRALASAPARMMHFDGDIQLLAVNPVRNWLAVAAGHKVHLLDNATGETFAVFDHGDDVHRIQFNEDWSLLMSGGSKTLHVWNVVAERAIISIEVDSWLKLATLDDGSNLLVYETDETMHLVDIARGEEVASVLGGSAFSIAPDSAQLLVRRQEAVHLWDIASGEEQGVFPDQRYGEILVNQDWSRLITMRGSTVLVWDIVLKRVLGTFPVDNLGQFLVNDEGSQLLTRRHESLVLWDVATGAKIDEFPLGGESDYWVNPDWTRLVILTDGVVSTWDISNLNQLSEIPLPSETFWLHPAFDSDNISPDGKYMVLAARQEAYVLDIQTGKLISGLGLDEVVNTPWFDPSSRRAVLYRQPYSVDMGGDTGYLVDLESGRILSTLSHESLLDSARFSPYGQQLLTLGDSAKIWNSDTGELQYALLEAHDASGWIFLPGGEMLLTIMGSTLHYWCIASAADLDISALVGCSHLENEKHVSPDGELSVMLTENDLHLWDINSGFEIASLHHPGVTTAIFTADSRRLVSSNGSSVSVWDSATGEKLGTVKVGENVVFRFDIDDVGYGHEFGLSEQLLLTSENGRVRVRSLDGKTLSGVLHDIGVNNAVVFAELDPSGQLLATIESDGYAYLWSLATGRLIRAFGQLTSELGDSWRYWLLRFEIVFGPKGRNFVLHSSESSTDSGVVQLYRVRHGTLPYLLDLTDESEVGTVGGIDFSPDGSRVILSGSDARIVWDTSSGKRVLTLPRESDDHLLFGPNSMLVAMISENRVEVRDMVTGQVADSLVTGQQIQHTAFSPDSRMLAIATTGGNVLLWEIGEGKAHRILAHDKAIRDLEFSPDGLELALAEEEAILVWNLADGVLIDTIRQIAPVESIDSVDFAANGSTLVVSGMPAIPYGGMRPGPPPVSRLQTADLGHLIKSACAIVQRDLNEEEWGRYLGQGTPYHPACRQIDGMLDLDFSCRNLNLAILGLLR